MSLFSDLIGKVNMNSIHVLVFNGLNCSEAVSVIIYFLYIHTVWSPWSHSRPGDKGQRSLGPSVVRDQSLMLHPLLCSRFHRPMVGGVGAQRDRQAALCSGLSSSVRLVFSTFYFFIYGILLPVEPCLIGNKHIQRELQTWQLLPASSRLHREIDQTIGSAF